MNLAHKCRYRLTVCPYIDGPCKDCKKVNYDPETKFCSDDLACHGVRHLYKKGDIIPDNLEEIKKKGKDRNNEIV